MHSESIQVMSTNWKPVPLSRDLVERLLFDQFPELERNKLLYITAGWSHDVWRCGDTLFRFPHQHCTSVSDEAVSILEQLAKLLPIRIPIATHHGEPTPEYPGAFVGYKWISGAQPSDLSLGESARAGLAGPLAQVLRVLHNIPTEVAKSWGVATTDKQGELALRAERGQHRATQLANSRYASLAADSAAAMSPPPPPCPSSEHRLVHGDLHGGQLLLDPSLQIVGIVDWDDLRVGDPAYDLHLVYALLPASATADFWEAYGPFKGMARARHLALSYGLAFLAQAVSDDDAEMADEAALGLERTLQHFPSS